ncbi:MAG: hypothetical protein LC714_03290 [Actinobacteria bacterium]|nr:hypothetical protein [Actinomycetota bacterium]
MRGATFAHLRLAALVVALCAALLAAGCEGGTLTNHSQSCTSTGLFGAETVTCSGTAGSVRGSVGIEFGSGDEELDGPYRLTATLLVGEGEASVYAYDTEGERVSLGRLSAGEQLNVDAVVEPSGGSSVFFVDTGEGEVRDLKYEGRIEPI